CNESKPICANCARLNLTCVYDRQPPENKPGAVQPKEKAQRPVTKTDDDHGDPPESERRRKRELQLLLHFVEETGPSLAFDDFSMKVWVLPLPRLALKSDALLYAMYCVSAVHSAYQEPEHKERHLSVCHGYLQMSLCEHAKEVSQLSHDNVDILILTSTLIRLYQCYKLQERPLIPYTPPTAWMRSTGSGSALFRQAWPLIVDNPSSIAKMLIGNIPIVMDKQARTAPESRQGLLHLLQRQEPHELAEPWSSDVQEAYESTLSYIGGIWIAMNNNENPGGVSKRLVIFPMIVDKRFIALVEEQRPRALAILAHYFALLSMLRGYWWMGDTGQREVRAIAEVMPDEWRSLMSWPLQILEQQIVFTGEQLNI
ncbi:hypothetical protein B0T10DRAFT_410500, partial [Thelonectria olida]